MATAAKFRIDVAIHDLLTNSNQQPPAPAQAKGLTLPEPVFPQFPERFSDPGPETPPERRKWGVKDVYRYSRGWLGPYVRSRVLPGEFHPITAYLFVEYKCNLDCWYCWSYNNKVKGMTEDVARRSIDWLHDNGCRVLALMGGEPLLRPEFIHKVVYYAARKGFWVYIATNGRLLKPDFADRLGDAGVAVFNFALDSWDLQPSLPKAFVPAQKNLEHILRKQYVDGYLVFFNINICRNNIEDVKKLTEYAHDHRIATDYHINETPMLEQDDHFKHLYDNPTYIRPEDWREIDSLVDWLIEKNKAGYQMVNSVQRLQGSRPLCVCPPGSICASTAGTAMEQNRTDTSQKCSRRCPELSRSQTASCILPNGTAVPDRTMSSSARTARSPPAFPCMAQPSTGETSIIQNSIRANCPK